MSLSLKSQIRQISTSNISRIVWKLDEIIRSSDKLISKLDELKLEIQDFKKKCNIAKGVGTTLNTVGSIAAISSLFFGPFGFVVAGSVAISTMLTGTGTNIATTILDSKKYNKLKIEIQTFLESFKKENEHFEKLIKLLVDRIFMYQNSSCIDFETAMKVIIANEIELQKYNTILRDETFQLQLREIQPKRNCMNLQAYILSKGLSNFIDKGKTKSQEIEKFGEVANLGLKSTTPVAVFTMNRIATEAATLAFSTATRIAVNVGLILQVVEIVTQVNDIFKNHRLITEIDKSLEDLNYVKSQYEILLEECKIAFEEGFSLFLKSEN